MSRSIQLRRGTAAEHENFTGAIGEVTMDTTNKTLRVHDGETVGGTALTKQQELFNGLNNKLNIDLDNLSSTAKATLVALCMPDYDHQIVGTNTTANTYITCQNDSFVILWAADPYKEDYSVLIKTDIYQNIICVGKRYDDTDGHTQKTSFTFLCPKNHSFTCSAQNGFEYRIIPLRGAH